MLFSQKKIYIYKISQYKDQQFTKDFRFIATTSPTFIPTMTPLNTTTKKKRENQ